MERIVFPIIRSDLLRAQKEEVDVALPWLMALRWGEFLCQVVLVISYWLIMDSGVPIMSVSAIFLFEVVSNLFLHYRHRHDVPVSNLMILVILLMDTVFLTRLLYVTGGAMNPFVFLYLIHVVTGAIILREKCSWLITFATLAGYSLLFYAPFTPDITANGTTHCLGDARQVDSISGSFQMHLKGMWAAFVVTTLFIVFFVSKIQQALTEQRIKLQSLGEERERNKRLTSMATFAAGAAHELSTPLSTVAVVSCEMIHIMEEQKASPELLSDIRLIRKQVADCKEILYQMTAGAGGHMGEEVREFSIQQVVGQILAGIGKDQQDRVRVTIEPEDLRIIMPFRSLCRTVKGLVKNGLEASSPRQEVSMRWFATPEYLGVDVRDLGTGIDEDVEPMVTEPSFTTKDSGLGLGLFLAKSMAEQFGGDLTIQSQSDHGTRVTLTLALELITKKHTIGNYATS